MLYYIDKNWYHFIKEYLEQISKFAFQEVARPVGWPNRLILEILLACSHTLVAQNCGTSVRLHHWGNLMFFLYFSYFSNCFCIFHSSFFIDFCHPTNRNQVFLFWNMFYHYHSFRRCKYEFCIWKTSLFNNLVVAAWNHTFYSLRYHVEISSFYCFFWEIYFIEYLGM